MASGIPSDGAAATPPAPPPKSGNYNASGQNTPLGPMPPPPPPPPPSPQHGFIARDYEQQGPGGGTANGQSTLPLHAEIGPDPGEGWLPAFLQDLSTQDLATIASSPELLNALTYAPRTAHPSLTASHLVLTEALSHNAQMAAQVSAQATSLSRQREATQAQLLATHALERQWRQRQSDMDHSLAPFSPASLYQRLAQSVQEQAAVCHAMEESFLEDESGPALEREVADWIRKYREAKVQLYLRQERKDRWDQGRVGGWR